MGLFDGLGAKFGQGLGKFGASGGGLLGGAHDMLLGTTPGMTSQSNDIQDPRLGTLHRAPTVTPTGGMNGGLLDKVGGYLEQADDRGLTGRDKLFAAGSIMQGDSGGAASYLANQRQAADAMTQRKNQAEIARLSMDALRGAYGPDGKFNEQAYLAALPAGADMSQAMKMREAMRPNLQFLQTANGGVSVGNQDTGEVTERVKGVPKAPGRFIQDENGEWVPNPVYQSAVQGEAAARRRGAPPVGRSGGRGPKRGSYGRDEVDFSGG